ncbi:hypothetical protein ESZ50_10215 [Weissella muntiaci]|uniref:Glucan-binding protein C/Surface antigen I/II V-domain domain-containing protein n=1 Tax=Weissella muntiaci TaxID=2508881 RepID=A0A6C2C3Y7_9LACO|nr:GbpC/Spa domain-containing protein [Weissella muntiaci]TYC47995.1 hypothetical protein ESZ50_10215 [Weissella muntiaci]
MEFLKNVPSKKAFALFSTGLMLIGSSPVGVVTAQALADDTDTSQSTSYNVDYTDSDKKIADAKAKGMAIKETTKTVTVNTRADAKKAQEQAKADKGTQDTSLDKSISSYNDWSGGNTGINGVKPGDINQQLIMKKEPNAKTEVNITNNSVTAKKLTLDQMNSGTTELPGGFNPSNSGIKSTYGLYVHSANGTKGVSGDFGTVTYSNLENTTYNGKKISKLEVGLSDLGDNPVKNSSWAPGVIIYQDPTDTIRNIQTLGTSLTYRYYDENGNKIDPADNTAEFTVGSLNTGYGDSNGVETATGDTNSAHYLRETVQVVDGSAKMYKLEGSSVTIHDDNKAYADASNTAIGGLSDPNHVMPKSWDGWDSTSASNRIVGSVLIGFKNGDDPKIRFATETNGTSDDAFDQWGTVSTTIDPSRPAPTGNYEKTNIVVKGEQSEVEKAFIADTSSWKLSKVSDETDAKGASNDAATPIDESTSNDTPKSDVEKNDVALDQSFGYTLTTSIDSFDKAGQPVNSFKLIDNLAAPLSLEGVQIIDKTDENKDITNDFSLTGKITATLNEGEAEKLEGHVIEARFGVKIPKDADLSGYKQDDGSYQIPNIGSKSQNEDTTTSNEVDVVNTPDAPAPTKEAPAKDLPTTGTTNPVMSFFNQLFNSFK